MRNIDIDLYTQESELNASEENIVIEITGLKSINKFIGLDDTPLYYEDGKFFKVEGNKIVYTDIEWSDLKGDVTENKQLIEQIEINAEKSAKKYTGQIVANAIDVHNNDVNSHPYLLNTIEENYIILDKKIDDTKIELETSISDLDQKLSKDIDDLDIKLSGEIEDLNQDLSDEITNRENADIEINNSITQLDEKVDGININLTKQIDDLEQDVNDKYNELVRDIDDLTDVVEEDYAKLNTKIDTTAQTINTRITNVADELQQSIEENVVALQQEDTALQNQINTHSQTLTAYDTRITNNANAIGKEIIDRQNADDALSDRIDAVESRGRFLALWNATTGLPESTPQITPYTYKTGDYYIVDAVGEVNYRPTGTEFVEGQPSTEIETEELTTDDVYYYDGAVWRLQVNHGKTVSFANLAGQPSDNTALKNSLDSKQDLLTEINAGENIVITTGAVVPIVPLPEGYTQLEYIESTGSQYITLESTTYNQNDVVEIDYAYTSFTGNYPTIFGSGLSEIYTNPNGDVLVFRSISVLEPTKYQLNRKQTTIASFTASITSNQCISAYYASGGATYFAMGKIYGFRHKRDNIVLKNLIPAREISTNDIGMYDIVNNTFINGSGIKQFVAGPIVAEGLKISADLSSKQDTLVSGINIKTLNNTSLLGSGNIDISSAEWGNITGDLADQTDLSDSLQNVREVAEGKTKSYVVSYADNPIFNTQDAEIKLDSTFTDVNGNIHDIEELKLGDNIFVQETDVPDRWCSQPSKDESTDKSVTLYKLETSKVDLTDYVKNTDYATTTSAGVVKTSTQYGIVVNADSGLITSIERNQSQYNSAPKSMAISKGTLENIKEDLVTSIGDTKYQPTGDYATKDDLAGKTRIIMREW